MQQPYDKTFFHSIDEFLSEEGLQKFDSLFDRGRRAKQKRIDSLKLLIKYAKPKQKVDQLIELEKEYNEGREHYLLESVRLAKKIGYVQGEAESRNLLGEYYISQDDARGAVQQFDQALLLWQKVAYEDGVVFTKMLLAYGYSFFDTQEAERYFKDASEQKKNVQDSIPMSGIELLTAFIGAELPSLGIDEIAHLQKASAFGEADPHMALCALSQLSIEIMNSKYYDECLQPGYLQKFDLNVLNRALALNDSSRIALMTSHIFEFLNMTNNPHYKKSLIRMAKKAVDVSPNWRDKQFSLSILGDLYEAKNQYVHALETYFNALEIAEGRDDSGLSVYIISYIIDIYLDLNDYDQALNYAYSLLEKCQKNSNEQECIITAKHKIGIILMQKENYAEALPVLQDLVSMNTELAIFKRLQVVGQIQMGYAFHKLGQSKRGLDTLKNMLDLQYGSIFTNMESTVMEAINGKMGLIYFETGQIKKATQYLNLGKHPHSNFSRNNLKIYEYLSKSYASEGDYEQAYDYLSKLKQLSDTLKDQKLLKKIGWLESKAELDKKSQQNELLTREISLLEKSKELGKKRNIIFIIIFLVLIGFIFMLVYISRQEHRTQRQLLRKEKEMDRVKSQFFSNISHELRTPLALIMAPLHDMLNVSNVREGKTISIALDQCNQLETLADEILDLSKIDAKKMEYRPVPINASLFLDRIFDGFKSLAKSRDIDMHLSSLIDNQKWLMLDGSKMEKILNNLLSNALKHTSKGGEVQMVVTKSDDQKMLKIMVKDNGKGIHRKDLPRIFDRYYQARYDRGKAMGGIGIGLNLSLELAKLSGGDLQVESIWKQGSTFDLTVPLIEMAPEQDKPDDKAKLIDSYEEDITIMQLPTIEKEHTILVAEDHLGMQDLLNQILSPVYQVKLANDGKEAWEIIKNEPIDLLITDMMMPEMDGLELLELMKSDKTTSRLPVIMLTARADIEDKLTALTIGIDDYMTKPFHSAELLARVKNSIQLLQGRRDFAKTLAQSETSDEDSKTEENLPQWGTEWLKEVESTIKKHLDDSHYTITDLARDIGVSERQVHRKIKQLSGLTANHYIRELKLCQARDMLEQGKVQTVAEACYSIGFDDAKYFSVLFKQRFGQIPSTYAKKMNKSML
ncbi:MAG: response regulator [Reichenbachiella sp.]|uniref:response regulator n=1 Tax=Reichenbachiella sp. TaxID=2184521 RepID=UPI003264B077